MWTIYSIGDSAYLERILIAVAMVVGTGDFTTVVRIGLLVGLLIVMFQALAQGAQQINWQQALVAWIIFSGLYGATTTVTIEDAYNGQVRTVANVPFGVVALGSLVSEIGFGLTDTFETAFSVPSITRNGFADAMEVVKRVRINSIDRIGLGYANDPSRAGRYDFEQSWISYIRNCTIQGIKIGSSLPSGGGTLTDSYIVNAANLLDALQYQNPSAGTQININGLQSPTCSDAYRTLQDYTLGSFYRDFLQETLANALGEPKDVSKVEARINQALGDLGLPFISAKDFVVTSVLEPMYGKAWASEHAADLVMSYAITIDNSLRQRAMQWNAEGSMWQRSIRPMITFLEGFVFAVTPFMALVIVMGPFGIRLAGKYLVLLFWIQLWLPVLSIVNLYIMMTIQGKMAALAGSGAGLTLTSISGMMNADGYIQEYLATGQMLAASTPMIALMLVTGAAVTATQFASRIQGGDFVDEKKVAPDTMNSVPFIQQQAPNQVDMQGGLRKQGAESVLPTFGFSSTAMEQVSREDGQMRQASAAFSEAFQKSLSQGTTSGSRFDSGDYFSSGRSSSSSRVDSTALDIGRSVADSHRSELGENYGRVVNAVAEASLGAKVGVDSGKVPGPSAKGSGSIGAQGALASTLTSQHGVSQSTAQAIEDSVRTAMTKGSSADAKLTEAVAADYKNSELNYYTSERGLKYDNSLRASADEVVARSQSYRQAVSDSRSARLDQQVRATDVAQRFAQDPELRGSLRENVQRLGLGGAVERYLDSKQGGWLTGQFNGDEQKAYDVASLMMLNGRAGAPNMDPERAQIAKDAANSLIYRGFGSDFGGFGSPTNYQSIGALAPSFGSIPGNVAPEVAPAGNISMPDQRPQGVAGPGGYGSLVDDAYAQHSAQVAGEATTNERKIAKHELGTVSQSLLNTHREINASSAEDASQVYNSLHEVGGKVSDLAGSLLPGTTLAKKHQDRIDGYIQEGLSSGLRPTQARYYALERYTSDTGTQLSHAALSFFGAKTDAMEQREALRQEVINDSGGGKEGIAAADIISHSGRTGTDQGLRQVGAYNEKRARFESLSQGPGRPGGATTQSPGPAKDGGTSMPLTISIPPSASGSPPSRRQ